MRLVLSLLLLFLFLPQSVYAACGLADISAVGSGGPFPDAGVANVECMKNPATLTEQQGTSNLYHIMKLVGCEEAGAGITKILPRYTATTKYTLNINDGSCAVSSETTYSRTPGSGYSYSSACSTRQVSYAGVVRSDVSSSCKDGCMYSLSSVTLTEQIKNSVGVVVTWKRGSWSPTGAVCGVGAPSQPAPLNDYCQDVGGGNQLCSNVNGQKCVVSGSTGRKYCWSSSQSGVAADPARNEAVSKSADSTAVAGIPAVAPASRPGESWQQGPNASITNTSSNVTNNFTNFNNAGTPNTNPASGVDGDGSANTGTAAGSSGDDKAGQTASGGLDCAAPPVCSDGSTIECADLQMNWRHMCDADQQFGDAFWHGVFDLFHDTTEEQVPPTGNILGADGQGDMDTHRVVNQLSADQLDASGFLGGGSCPSLPTASVAGIALPIDFAPICELLANVGNIVIALAYFIAFKIIATGGR